MAGDRDQHSCSRDAELGILEVRVETLSATVSEVKDLVKRIEEAVGIVRIVQVHAEQHAQEYEKLTGLVHELSQSLSAIEDELHTEVANAKADLKKELTTLAETGNTRESAWKEKYNVLRGIIIGVGLLAGVLTGVSAYLAKNASDVMADTYKYVLQLQTIDALEILKGQMNRKDGQQ